MPRYIYNAQTLTELTNGRLVNSYKGKMLGRTYHVCDGKLFKQMKDGKFRELCPQHNNYDGFAFYFIKNKNGGKSRVSVKKLSEMVFEDYENVNPMTLMTTVDLVEEKPEEKSLEKSLEKAQLEVTEKQ